MELLIKKHEISCIIGVWAHERTQAQRVGMDVRLEFDGEKAGTSDRLEDTINYAQLAETATFILKHSQFQLLESAVCSGAVFYFHRVQTTSVFPPRPRRLN